MKKFWEIFEKKDFGFAFFLNGYLFLKIRVGYMYIEESFDTTFNMGYPPPKKKNRVLVGKAPIEEKVKIKLSKRLFQDMTIKKTYSKLLPE